MSRLRVLNLGLPKTGTTSLSRALRRANLSVADWRIRNKQTENPLIRGKLVGAIMYRDYFATGDPLHNLDQFDAVTEMSVVRFGNNLWPQMDWGLLSAIQEHHPGAKFLLSYRDPDKTASSMLRWSNMGSQRLPANQVPGLPKGFGKTQDELARWVAGHFAFCRRVFAGCDNFLEYDIEDPASRDKIAAFLGRPMPWWGQANRNAKKAAEAAE